MLRDFVLNCEAGAIKLLSRDLIRSVTYYFTSAHDRFQEGSLPDFDPRPQKIRGTLGT